MKRDHLLRTLWALQHEHGCIPRSQLKDLARQMEISEIEIEGVVTFYHFFSLEPRGRHVIYLNDSILSRHTGFAAVQTAFEQATGAPLGGVSPSGEFGFFSTSCIGWSEAEPAALIDFFPFTNLTPERVHALIDALRQGASAESLCQAPPPQFYPIAEAHRTVFLRDFKMGASLRALAHRSPDEILEAIRDSGLRGMGGAFFPTATKWQSARDEHAARKFIVCNADEGEPGTFKDRALLHVYPRLVLEGMIIAGRAVGAGEGIVYLRGEYQFLLAALQKGVAEYEEMGFLGENACGIAGFHFHIRIELGAGAYVCGEESALLQSMEGFRGEPTTKTFFPTQKGFLGYPTVVNNVETFAAAARILELGAPHFAAAGTSQSSGTKLLSVAGDCRKPGIYEIEWGMTLGQLLAYCEASQTAWVQVGGPSGELCTPEDFNRTLSFEDLRCGGSVMIFDTTRHLSDILLNYQQFFIRESCGICTPCRAGNFILGRKLEALGRKMVRTEDLAQMRAWSHIIASGSRCGLGKSATNALLQAMDKAPEALAAYLDDSPQTNPRFSLEDATQEYDRITGQQLDV